MIWLMNDNMDITQKVEDSRLRRVIKNARKSKSYNGGSSKGGLDFKTSLGSSKGSPIKLLLSFQSLMMIRCSPKSQREIGGGLPSKKPTCTMCGKMNVGECLVGTDNYFGCGNGCHKVRDFPNITGQ